MTAVGTAVFTVVEVVFLATWLALAKSARQVLNRVAPVVLFVGLVVEHVVQFNVARGRRLIDLTLLPIRGILTFSGIETVIWAVWLPLSLLEGNATGFVFLAASLVAKHAVADNVIAGRPLFDRGRFDFAIVVASVLEAMGGQAWLIDVLAGRPGSGVAKLAGFSFAEHLILVLNSMRQIRLRGPA